MSAMPAHDHAATLECAGNGRLAMRQLPTGEPWADFAVSTARWTGALVHEVLAKVKAAITESTSSPSRRPASSGPVTTSTSGPTDRTSSSS
jgi:hypothetical protein